MLEEHRRFPFLGSIDTAYVVLDIVSDVDYMCGVLKLFRVRPSFIVFELFI